MAEELDPDDQLYDDNGNLLKETKKDSFETWNKKAIGIDDTIDKYKKIVDDYPLERDLLGKAFNQKRKAGRPKGSKNKAKSPNYPQQGIKMRATIIIDYLIDKGDYRRVVELEDEMIALLQKYSADNPNVIMMDKVDKSGSTVHDDDGNVIREKAAQVVFNPRRGEKPPNINNMKFRTS